MQDMIDEKLLRTTIATNLLRLRIAMRWSQEELAARAGLSRVHLSRIENGRNTPSAEMLYSLADALNVSTDSLRQVSEKISVKSA